MFRNFVTSEAGAVTVDWVVLTAGLVGLGLATTAVVSSGIANVSGDTAGIISGYEIVTAFTETTENTNLGGTGFFDGAGSWLGGVATYVDGFGEILQIQDGGVVSSYFELPEDTTMAYLEFDLIGGDSLDGEPAYFVINGQQVAVANGQHSNGTMNFTSNSVEGMTFETTTVSQGSDIGGSGNTNWMDSVTTVRVSVENPGPGLSVEVYSGTNQGPEDEFYAVDNVSVSADHTNLGY
jgi:hypothetical protein